MCKDQSPLAMFSRWDSGWDSRWNGRWGSYIAINRLLQLNIFLYLHIYIKLYIIKDKNIPSKDIFLIIFTEISHTVRKKLLLKRRCSIYNYEFFRKLLILLSYQFNKVYKLSVKRANNSWLVNNTFFGVLSAMSHCSFVRKLLIFLS